jgi:error-prone DNA polymerase
MKLKALLNTHSYFSFGAGVSSPTSLVNCAAEIGFEYLALTDTLGVYGAAELYGASQGKLKPILGATIPLRHGGIYPLVLLAGSRRGYEKLNDLITLVKASKEQTATLSMIEAYAHEDLHCLTGGRKGFLAQLLGQKKVKEARYILGALKNAFHDRLWIQLFYDCYPWDIRRMNALRELARESRISTVAAPEVRYTTGGLMPLYDTLMCARLGITLSEPHRERPANDCQAIPRGVDAIPYPEAVSNANLLAEALFFDLLPKRLESPPARVPEGYNPDEYLERICREKLLERYRGAGFGEAKERLERELYTLKSLGFADFFLVVKEVMDFCKSRSIIASGRGSAASSVVCYLLGITQSDPVSNNLLFERFLHSGKRNMPDIDIDISSSRRDEVFDWVEQRFPNSAMVCNRITYYLPSAIQDVGRALGIPPHLRNVLTKSLGRDFSGLRPHKAREAGVVFDEVLGDAPVKEVFYQLLEMMERGFVRQVAPHSGGWVLSRYPLNTYSPLERSTGGLRCVQFDKDDIETLGLMKLDLLGLRMLGVFERTREELWKTEKQWLDVEDLPDDNAIWQDIGAGDTMAVFQIESPGQVRMSVQLKPETRKDLKDQVALFRPGPIQSNTVHPYVARRQGKQKIVYVHPALEKILGRSYGVILFQEQVMEIAHHVAGFDWEAADTFRKTVASFEDEHEISGTRERFISGATVRVGATRKQAEEIFNMCAAFRGYGFAESHAWAFGNHTYTSAYLRHHFPAEYFAGVMSEEPGMYSPSTLRQEAERRGVGFGRLDINTSSYYYQVEKIAGGKRLRPSLCSVKGVSKEAAKEILLERYQRGPFLSLQDLVERTNLDKGVLEQLAKAGAFDRLIERREALYQLAVLIQNKQPQQKGMFKVTDVPRFPELSLLEKIEWDYKLKGLTEHLVHPTDMYRQELLELGATPMTRLHKAAGHVRTAGLVIARQKPPTANGFAFYLLEDGQERIQVVLSPDVWERSRTTLRDTKMLMTEGTLHREQRVWTLQAEQVWAVGN